MNPRRIYLCEACGRPTGRRHYRRRPDWCIEHAKVALVAWNELQRELAANLRAARAAQLAERLLASSQH